MRGIPINFFSAFEVAGFGAFCGATHSTFHVKKHPTYVTNGVRLTFLFENSYKFHFLTKNYEKIKIFLYSYLPISQKYSIIDTLNIPWCNSLSVRL
jgi:hypothetical protein